jgi:hypothetical protein
LDRRALTDTQRTINRITRANTALTTKKRTPMMPMARVYHKVRIPLHSSAGVDTYRQIKYSSEKQEE